MDFEANGSVRNDMILQESSNTQNTASVKQPDIQYKIQNPLISNSGPKPTSRFLSNKDQTIEEYESELQLPPNQTGNDI